MTTPPTEPWRWRASELARAIRLGRVSAREAAPPALAHRIEARPAVSTAVALRAAGGSTPRR